MPDLGIWEILVIAAVVMVLFGSKKLPGAARSLGQSMRIFKSEVKGMREDEEPAPAPAPAPAPVTPPQQQLPAVGALDEPSTTRSAPPVEQR